LDTMNQYVATYIPDVDYLQTYRNVAHEEGINCAELYEFSGVVMYTMLSGHYVAAYRYDGGTLTERAFLYDREQTSEENIADFCAVMEGVTLGVAVEQEGTRAIIPDIIWSDPNSNVMYVYKYIGSYSHLTEYDPLSPEDYEVVEPEWENREGAGGGGGGPAEEEEEEDPTGEEMLEDLFETSNLTEEEKKIVSKMLEEIYDDCMGRELIVSLVSKNNKINLVFSYNNRAGFNPTKGIRLNNDHSEALLHELFHAYQCSQVTATAFYTSVANYEVEAYLATYMYMDRCLNTEVYRRQKRFKNRIIGTQVITLQSMIFDNTSFLEFNSEKEDYFHELFISTSISYGSTNNCTVDVKQPMEDHLKNLQKITINCN